ncbi:hypothetical protein DMB95_00100 [Campylobacter sp. MIT 12-8780]|uniref:hypothetical protein n=1 Tax=Campylobacter sp. MIT 12-8780 TaxID=2202200 RepID=UPI00115CF795|nr:hypothetical protein [Campylobacter sp. MIT 12-8780]TQR42937.1 hypothetical protein DMB95_00100 [Campylobacter sp. MIT 12-8780]
MQQNLDDFFTPVDESKNADENFINASSSVLASKTEQDGALKPQDESNLKPAYNPKEASDILKQAELSNKNLQTQSNRPLKLTGVRYLDDKIRADNVSMYDAYLAKKYLGIDNEKFSSLVHDGVMAIKGVGGTASMDKMGQDVEANNAYLRAILKSQGNLGTSSGLSRMLNFATNKLWGLDSNHAEFVTEMGNVVGAHARNLTGNGRTTEGARKDAQMQLGVGFTDEKQFLGQMLSAMKSTAVSQGETIKNNINKSLPVPQSVLENFARQQRAIDFVEKSANSNKPFNYKAFYELINGKQKAANAQANTSLRQIQ